MTQSDYSYWSNTTLADPGIDRAGGRTKPHGTWIGTAERAKNPITHTLCLVSLIKRWSCGRWRVGDWRAASRVTSGLTLELWALSVRPDDWTVHMRQWYAVREDVDSKVLKADIRRGSRSAVGWVGEQPQQGSWRRSGRSQLPADRHGP
jgi:hypothetical protein